MKKIILILIIISFFYLIAWPIPIDPVKWSPQTAPDLEEEYTVNNYI